MRGKVNSYHKLNISNFQENLKKLGRCSEDGERAYRVLLHKPHKTKLSPYLDERKCEFRNHESIAILGIPDVVVREAIDVGVERAIGVDVHVSNEEFVR